MRRRPTVLSILVLRPGWPLSRRRLRRRRAAPPPPPARRGLGDRRAAAAQERHRDRPRRRGHLGRRRRLAHRPRGAAARRQRRRRRGRHGGRARGHRALQRRRRRRRLLRPLRRRDRAGCSTIDGRETAPAAIPRDAFIDPATGEPYPFTPDLVTSGVSVGVPGTPATWRTALRPVGHPLAGPGRSSPRARLAERGFVVDETFRSQTEDNGERFAAFTSHQAPLPPRRPLPEVGTRFRNPDLARTYRAFGRDPDALLRAARCPREIVRRRPPPADVAGDTDLPVPPRLPDDRATSPATAPRSRRPRRVGYRGLDVFGMRALLQRRHHRRRGAQHPRGLRPRRDVRGRLPAPLPRGQRAGLRRPRRLRRRRPLRRRPGRAPCSTSTSPTSGPARSTPTPPRPSRSRPATSPTTTACCGTAGAGATSPRTHENVSTTHLTVADRWGNVVSYTLTIEQTGGSGIVVPGRGFLLNNELTDFSLVYDADDPNRLAARQAPAQLDVADDRAARRQAVPRARLARRLDDHHDGPAGAAQPPRPRP